MKLTSFTRLGIMVILAMSLSLGLSSCSKDDSADPTTTNNNTGGNNDPDPVVKQKLTIWLTQGTDDSPMSGKDIKLASTKANLDQGILIGTKTTNTFGWVEFEVEPGTYYFRSVVAGGPLGTITNSATVKEGFDADGFLHFN